MKMSVKKLNIIALVLVLILLGSYFLVRSSCGIVWRGNPIVYYVNREEVEAEVQGFMEMPKYPLYNHTKGEVPIVNETVIAVNGSGVISGEDYYVIAACALVYIPRPWMGDSIRPHPNPRGFLNWVHPRNCILEGANAEAGVVNCSADCTGNYVWLTTINGDVASICIGAECEANGEDGRQIPDPSSRGRIPSGAEPLLLVSIITVLVLWIAFNLYYAHGIRKPR